MKHAEFQSLGFGLGFRHVHYSDILEGAHRIQWFEALTENYLGLEGLGPGPAFEKLLKIRERYPVVLHGVSLSIGGTAPFSPAYLNAVKSLIDRIEPLWVSDHLCWTGVHGRNSHDLLPLPFTPEVVDHVVARIQKVQEYWRRPLVIENVSSYVEFTESTMNEAEFLRAVVERSGCYLLLDVNNIFVSSRNHGFHPEAYLREIPWSRVVQLHLAGHTDRGDVIIDTHDAPIRAEVWDLYRQTLHQLHRAGELSHVSTMIERDAHIPPLAELDAELQIARGIHDEITQRPANALFL